MKSGFSGGLRPVLRVRDSVMGRKWGEGTRTDSMRHRLRVGYNSKVCRVILLFKKIRCLSTDMSQQERERHVKSRGSRSAAKLSGATSRGAVGALPRSPPGAEPEASGVNTWEPLETGCGGKKEARDPRGQAWPLRGAGRSAVVGFPVVAGPGAPAASPAARRRCAENRTSSAATPPCTRPTPSDLGS